MIDYEVEYSHVEDVVCVNVWQDDELTQQFILPKNVPVDELRRFIERAITDFSEQAEAI